LTWLDKADPDEKAKKDYLSKGLPLLLHLATALFFALFCFVLFCFVLFWLWFSFYSSFPFPSNRSFSFIVKKLKEKCEELKNVNEVLLQDLIVMAKNFVAQMELRFSAPSVEQQLGIVTLMLTKLRAEQDSWLATYKTHGAVKEVLS